MHLAMVALLLAIIKKEDVLAADALCLGALACTTGMEDSSDESVKMLLPKLRCVFFSVALGGAAGADLIKDACPHVRALSDRV